MISRINIKSERLEIFPLSEIQLRMYVKNDLSLEKSLDVKLMKRKVPKVILDVVKNELLPKLQDEKKTKFFCTFWLIIDSTNNTIVGDFCFKNKPNQKGEIEIGYGIVDAFQGNGYMSETVGLIKKWVFENKYARSIIAETAIDNIASIQVLKKNGFYITKKTSEDIFWKVDSL